jgi:hypothetical protein
MDKYIIVREMKMNGVPTTLYFETVSECKNNQVMNVFQEHITRDKAKAKRFYDIEEAERFKALFSREYNTSTILTVKK